MFYYYMLFNGLGVVVMGCVGFDTGLGGSILWGKEQRAADEIQQMWFCDLVKHPAEKSPGCLSTWRVYGLHATDLYSAAYFVAFKDGTNHFACGSRWREVAI